jgi:hypothetical protein
MELTPRTIIGIEPEKNITALDVTSLDQDSQQRLATLYEDYMTYRTEYAKSAFSFEDWAEHTTGARPDVKWRAFDKSRIIVAN